MEKTKTYFLKYILKPIVIGLAVSLVSTFVLRAVAAPPTSPYNPGEILNPTCGPGDPFCYVVTPAISGANSDITSLSGLTTALSVNQGGTGQTIFTKGDLLVGSSTNSLAKLSVGTDGKVLVASSSSPYGVSWEAVSGVGGGISGSGTPNQIAFWNSSNSLGSSDSFALSNGKLGIGTTTPASSVTINGDLFVNTSSTLGNVISGNWLASAIGDAYISSAANWNGMTPSSTQVIAGTGMSGGGALTGNVTLNNAGVLSLTASSPLSVTNSTGTITISMPTSTAGQSGYLSSGDWTIFNDKQNNLNGNYVATTTGNWIGVWQNNNPSDFLSSSTNYLVNNLGNWAGTWQNNNPSYFQTNLNGNYIATSTGNDWLGLWQGNSLAYFQTNLNGNYVATSTGDWLGTWQTFSPSNFLASTYNPWPVPYASTTGVQATIAFPIPVASTSLSATLPLNLNGNVLSMPTSTTAQNGFLTSDDWNTFNNKSAQLWGLSGSNLFASSTSWNVGIGTTTPAQTLTVFGSFSVVTSTSNGLPAFYVSSTTGRVGIGTSTPQENFVVNGSSTFTGFTSFSNTTPKKVTGSERVQFEDADGNNSDWSFRVATDGWGSINFAGSGGTLSAPTLSTSSDSGLSGNSLGAIYALGYDGTNYENAASILFQVDARPGNNDMPGRIVFNTTPDGSNTSAERMRITNSGKVGIGTAAPFSRLTISTTSSTKGLILLDSGVTYTSTSTALNVISIRPDDTTKTSIKGYQLTINNPTTTTGLAAGISLGVSTQLDTITGAIRAIRNSTGGGAGDLAFYALPYTGGLTEAMRLASVASTTYVGIGTSTPTSLLEIQGGKTNIDANPVLTITSATSNTAIDPYISFRTGAIPTKNFVMGVDYFDSNKFVIATSTLGTNDVFVIDQSGKVGVGTSTPGSVLTVNGDLFVNTSSTLGTVISGIWNGTAIDDGYISSASFWSGMTPSSTQVIAGTGMSGGGALTGNVTLNNAGVLSLTATSPLSVTNSTGTITISMPTSTASQDGFLTSSDWNTFNNKESQLWGLSGSNLFASSTSWNVGIGNTSPATALDVTGTSTVRGNINLVGSNGNSQYLYDGLSMMFASSTTSNYFAFGAGNQTATGTANIGIGYGVMANSTAMGSSTAVGYQALAKNTSGVLNSAFGYYALSKNTTGNYNSAFGDNALSGNTVGSYNSVFGHYALSVSTSSNNSVFGYGALQNSIGGSNSALGMQALYANRAGSGNSALGFNTGAGGTLGLISNSTLMGYQSGYKLSTSTANILIGYQAGYSLTTASNTIVIGYNSDLPATTTSTLDIANLIYATGLTYNTATTTAVSAGNVGIGTSTPNSKLTVNGDLFVNTSSTLGTVISGIWNGTAIDDGYISSASFWSGMTPSSTQVIAGTGMSGGGALTGNVTLNNAGVLSLTATSPLSVSNSTGTINISMPTSTAGQDGFLTANDWTIFNNKQDNLNGNYVATTTGNWIGTWQNYNLSDFVASSTLASYVPYTGASSNVDLGSKNLNVGTERVGLNFDNVNQVFSGTGNDDLGVSNYHGNNATDIYTITVDGVLPDTFKWRKNGGAETTGVPMITGDWHDGYFYQTIDNAVNVFFPSANGITLDNSHTLGDHWTISPILRSTDPDGLGIANVPRLQVDGDIQLWGPLGYGDTGQRATLWFGDHANNSGTPGMNFAAEYGYGFHISAWDAPDAFNIHESTGNVIIGTTTDDGLSKLQVKGVVKIIDSTSNVSALFDTSLLTVSDKTFIFPDKSGIFAMLDDVNLKVSSSTQVIAGTGMSGGGSLTGNVTLNNAGVLSLTATSPLSVSNSTGTINIFMPTSTASQDGFLTAADWNTFNNKQSQLWVNSGTSLYPTSTSWFVGIGTTTPQRALSISGTGQSQILLNDTAATSTANSHNWGLMSDNGYLRFRSMDDNFNGTDRLTISTSSNLDLLGNGGMGQYQYDNLSMMFASSTTSNYFAFGAGNTTATGTKNIGIGDNALGLLTTGSANVALGYGAFASSTTMSSSTAVGYQALAFSTTGAGSNSAFGYQSLMRATTGIQNSAFGFQALSSSTATGVSAFGYKSLAANNTGTGNSAFGFQSLLSNGGSHNSAFGHASLQSNSTNSDQSAFGYTALLSNFASQNSAFGSYALASSTSGNNNSAFGFLALQDITSGQQNSAFGAGSLFNAVSNSTTTSSGNSAFGFKTGGGNSGIGNGVFGAISSSTLIGYQSGFKLSTSTANILIGYNAGYSLGVATSNIVIGYNTDLPSNSTSTLDIANLIYATGLTYNISTTTAVSAGNVGIGTTTPSQKLTVNGGFFVGTSTNPNFFVNSVNGYVGIGTSTPQYLLDVNGNARVRGTLYFLDGSGMTAAAGTATGFSSATDLNLAADSGGLGSGAIIFSTDATNRMMLTNGGFLGIGNITPSTMLDVSGTSTIRGNINLVGNGVSQYLYDNLSMMFASSTTSNYFAFGAGNTTSTGIDNIGIGFGVLDTLTTGSYNVALGYGALAANATGTANVAIGYQAMNSNINFSSSTAVGYQALMTATSSNANIVATAFGYRALASSTIATNNAAFGYNALAKDTSGSNNAAFGATALSSLTTGASNAAFGYNALAQVTSASNDSAFGYLSQQATNNGSNSSFGFQALQNNTSSNNSAFGAAALQNDTSGLNSVFGYQAFLSAKTGSGNSGLGYNNAAGGVGGAISSSTLIGYQSGYSLSTSTANILIGYQAGYSLTVATSNIVIGYNTDLASTTTNTLDIANLIYATGLTYNTATTTAVSAGNVGIGTTTPSWALTVGGGTTQKDVNIPNGFLCVLGGDNQCPAAGTIADAGLIYASSTSITQKDLAENYLTLDSSLEAGDVVAVDPNNSEHIVKADSSYQQDVIGVISTAPGVLLGGNSTSSKPVALAGRTPVKVSTANGPIKIGDYLTSSDVTGIAMKAIEPGMVIGIAMEAFGDTTGTGKITVFVKPQWSIGQLVDDEILNNNQPTVLGQFALAVKNSLKQLGLSIENGVAHLKELIVDRLTVKTARIEKMEMVDQATGDIYCTWLENGEWQKVKSSCDSLPAQTDSAHTDNSNSGGDSTASPDFSASSTTSGDNGTTSGAPTSSNSNLDSSISAPDNSASTENSDLSSGNSPTDSASGTTTTDQGSN